MRDEETFEIKYDDGYRYMTAEEYSRLYTLNDLKNTLISCGYFFWEHRTLAFTGFSFLSGFVSFRQIAHASTKVPSNFTETTVLNQTFDQEKSFQEFMKRTGNVKTNQFKGFGKSHRLGSAFENQSFLKQPRQKNFFTLATFVKYANGIKEKGIVFRPAILNNVQNVVHDSGYILALRGGGGARLVFSITLHYLLVSILLFRLTIEIFRTIKKVVEEVISDIKYILKNRKQLLEDLRNYTNFKTYKPYVLILFLGLLYLAFRNSSSLLTVGKSIFGMIDKQLDVYIEIGIAFLKNFHRKLNDLIDEFVLAIAKSNSRKNFKKSSAKARANSKKFWRESDAVIEKINNEMATAIYLIITVLYIDADWF